MTDAHVPDPTKKTYYVAVGAGQILADPEAASYELVIRANEEELNKLQEMFEEASSADEAGAFHFSGLPTISDHIDNDIYDQTIHGIYKYLHELGTNETKRHIESMNILE